MLAQGSCLSRSKPVGFSLLVVSGFLCWVILLVVSGLNLLLSQNGGLLQVQHFQRKEMKELGKELAGTSCATNL